MSGTYAGGDQDDTRTGRIMVTVSSSLATVLLIAGLIYALGIGGRHEAALAAAGCEPNLSPSGLQCTTAQMLASDYTNVMTAASQQLNADAAAYTASERDNLAAAKAALAAEVASEHALGAHLAAIRFPPAIAPTASALAQANQARARLTAEQARSSSLTRLRSFNHRVQAASAAVQNEMKLVGEALDKDIPTKGRK
jgi:hypothetical protein